MRLDLSIEYIKNLFCMKHTKIIIFILLVLTTLFIFTNQIFFSTKVSSIHEKSAALRAVPNHLTLESTNGAYQKNSEQEGGTYSPVSERRKDQSIQKETKIVKKGNLHLEVSSVPVAIASIIKLNKKWKGYIEKNSSNWDERKRGLHAQLFLRVPPIDLEKAIQSIAKLGKIKSQSIEAKNITEEYYTIDIRLKNKLALRSRYLQLLKRKANTVSDIIKIENAIHDLVSEIENLQSTIQYYDKWLSYSTLHIYLHEPDTILPNRKHSIFRKFSESFIHAFYLFIDLLNFLVLSLGLVLPLLLIVFIYKRKYFKKPIQSKRKSKK